MRRPRVQESLRILSKTNDQWVQSGAWDAAFLRYLELLVLRSCVESQGFSFCNEAENVTINWGSVQVTKFSGHDLRPIKLEFLKSDPRLFGPILSTPPPFSFLLFFFLNLSA